MKTCIKEIGTVAWAVASGLLLTAALCAIGCPVPLAAVVGAAIYIGLLLGNVAND
jgi:hypothetical protein